jgi:hypothetical protein
VGLIIRLLARAEVNWQERGLHLLASSAMCSNFPIVIINYPSSREDFGRCYIGAWGLSKEEGKSERKRKKVGKI